MRNKPKPTSRPKKQPNSALIKTPAVKAALLGKKKKPAEKTDKKKIGTLDNANLHKMERELRETKERLRLLSEAAEEGIAVHYNGLIIEANDVLARIFGYELSEMIGMKAENFATPESWKVIQKHIAAGYDKPYESVGVRKDGTTFICSLVGKPYKYKGRILRLSTFHNITEQKCMEDKINRDEQIFRTFIERSSDIIVFVNRKGIVTYENQAMEKLLGFKPEERIGVNVFDRIHPDDLKFARDMFNKFTVNTSFKDINSPVRQIRLRHQDGSWRTFETKAIKLIHNNIVETIIINLRDISEHKKAEEELKKYRKHLEELVRERTIKLEAAYKELEAFSYSASHDLRAPLRSIDGFSQALLEDCEDKLDIQGKDYLIRIRAAIKRMAELIEDLLQLSRITRTEMDIEKINLTRIARFVIDELQKSQPQRIVDTRIAEGMEETADSKLMRIVLENLLGNAWKFTEKQAKAVIEFGCTKKGEKKVYFIRDNGVGFDMAYADKLFAPFQRLHTEEEFPGTGIGLATVRRIIHRHGGKIWTEGQTSKGATFYFSLNEK